MKKLLFVIFSLVMGLNIALAGEKKVFISDKLEVSLKHDRATLWFMFSGDFIITSEESSTDGRHVTYHGMIRRGSEYLYNYKMNAVGDSTNYKSFHKDMSDLCDGTTKKSEHTSRWLVGEGPIDWGKSTPIVKEDVKRMTILYEITDVCDLYFEKGVVHIINVEHDILSVKVVLDVMDDLTDMAKTNEKPKEVKKEEEKGIFETIADWFSGDSDKKEDKQKEEPKVCRYCKSPDSKILFNDLYGDVNLRCDSEEDDAYEYAELESVIYENDRIRTKEESGAILGFEDLGTFVIKENSILVINHPEKGMTKLQMVTGRIWGNIKKMLDGQAIECEMFNCTSGIKGTIFELEESGSVSRAWLYSSKMSITSKKTGKTIMLSPGQCCEVGKDGNIKVEEFDIEKRAEQQGISMWDIRYDQFVKSLPDGVTPEGIATWTSVVFRLLLIVVMLLAIVVNRK